MKINLLNTKEKGITLIALVITIIVLLILAGVSISMIAGENGILTQSTESKKKSEIAEAKEQAKIDIMAWRTKQLGKGLDATVNNSQIQTILTGKDYVLSAGATSFETKRGYIILYSELYSEQAIVGEKVTGENKEYTNNGTAVIPVGFTIVPGLDDVEKGLVISDNENDTELDADETKHVAEGNQFVWVPVSKENFATEFVREHFGTEEQKWWSGDFVTDGLSANNLYEPVADGITVDEDASESMQEVQKMYKSVKNNGGFYIGRYEAGNEGGTYDKKNSAWDDKGETVVKKDMQVYNYITWANAYDMSDETGGAIGEARKMANKNNYETVTSTLVYGVQWDAVLRWISKDEKISNYLTESTGKGNFYEDANTNSWKGKVTETGKIAEYAVKNIYDMAGNVDEWTMESPDFYNKILRGGHYNWDGVFSPISKRTDGIPEYAMDLIGFRIALYLNV